MLPTIYRIWKFLNLFMGLKVFWLAMALLFKWHTLVKDFFPHLKLNFIFLIFFILQTLPIIWFQFITLPKIDNNCSLIFDSSGLVIQDKTTHKILYQGPCHKGLYPLMSNFKSPLSFSQHSSTAFVSSVSSSAELWHRRLGHRSQSSFVQCLNKTT